ncbi:MAG: type I DNA topoisomerase [Geminicoccaceae bacterium]|nr:type I DNA topoisomerase [Geminicoccaceae bacterium]
MDLVVVESPTKAKSIAKYLGPGYEVTASFGHVRDLLAEENAVRPEEDFAMSFALLEGREKRVKDIGRELKRAKRLYLATDPDREGEAISWHLYTLLQEENLLKGVEVKRVVFHEVTKRAVLDAMRHPRDLDQNLIDAYLARRALDHLVGFRLSPVLWRKLQGAKSAGRVQSVALRLVCEREDEIDAFERQEYWTVEAMLRSEKGEGFAARLTRLDGGKLQKFDLADEAKAKAAAGAVRAADLKVADVEKKQVSRNPAPPFSTSTLQQEASRKLGFSADRTMKTAQRLFEGIDLGGETVGLITYMRTDSVQLSSEALAATRAMIGGRFGGRYLPDGPRQFKTKTKNAQEAHEAIRPTDPARLPADVGRYMEGDQKRLYELVWQRTVASQMAAAVMDRVTVDVTDEADRLTLRATGQTVAFDGFLKLYQEGRDDPAADEDEGGALLPALVPGQPVRAETVTPSQHFTEPPPRYTEASLVKRLEELGIGRPSTYASIISVLQAREYVRLEAKRFVPEDRGRLVTAFLTSFFDTYVQPGFTASLEDKLDLVAAGELVWKEVLRDFWPSFQGRIAEVSERRVADIIEALNESLKARLFPPRADGGDPRACPTCGDGRLSLKTGRYGAFVGCSNYPECRYTRRLADAMAGNDAAERGGDRLLGVEPEGREEVWVKDGRFGPYVQSGSGDTVKRQSLAPGMTMDAVDLDTALRLLALPREIGRHPETGEPVTAGLNRRGPFVAHGDTFAKLSDDDEVLAVGMNRALALLAEDGRKARGPVTQGGGTLKDLGPHPKDRKPIRVLAGRFGPYVKWGSVNASLPKGKEAETLTVDEALALIDAKSGKKTAKKKTAAAKAEAEPAAKKPAAKKTVAKPAAKTSPAKPKKG